MYLNLFITKFFPSSFLSTCFTLSAFFTAQVKKVWSPPLALCVINSSNDKLLEAMLGPPVLYRAPHEPQNKAFVTLVIFFAPHTVLCKKNANEFRRNSLVVLSKFRRNFGARSVIFWPNFRRSLAEPQENSKTGRKFPNLTTKFRLEFVRTETKMRKSNNEISLEFVCTEMKLRKSNKISVGVRTY